MDGDLSFEGVLHARVIKHGPIKKLLNPVRRTKHLKEPRGYKTWKDVLNAAIR
jgi:hypothetical protein